jgi:hypothetical protein
MPLMSETNPGAMPLAQITGIGYDANAMLAQFFTCPPYFFGIAGTDGEVGSLAGKPASHNDTQAARTAGEEHCFAGEGIGRARAKGAILLRHECCLLIP